MSYETLPIAEWVPGVGDVYHYDGAISVGPQYLTLDPMGAKSEKQEQKH